MALHDERDASIVHAFDGTTVASSRSSMAKKKQQIPGIAGVPAFEGELVNVIIETSKGSRNKLAYDDERQLFQLKSVLPAGNVFPFDFGFVAGTRAEDGDPIDVLLLMDEPVPTGTLVPARLVGVVEVEQNDDGKKVKNDRLLAVAAMSRDHRRLRDLPDLSPELLEEIEHFLCSYTALSDKKVKILRRGGRARARKLVRRAAAAVKSSKKQA